MLNKNRLIEEITMKKEKKQWDIPEIITYSEDEIIRLIGPAQTCAPAPSCLPSP